MATYSGILAWKIPWTERPDGLQSMGSQRVGHDQSNLAHMRRVKCQTRKASQKTGPSDLI